MSGEQSTTELSGARELYRRTRTGGIKLVRRIPGVRKAARAIAGGPKVKVVKAAPARSTTSATSARSRPPVVDAANPTHDVTGHPAGVRTRAGRFFPPGRGQTLPLVLVVALDADAEAMRTLCRRLEQAQFRGAQFRPLIVTSAPHFAVIRSFDYPVEHLMSEAHYTALNPHHRYGTYVNERISWIARTYRARAIVPLGPDAGAHLTDDELRLIGAFGGTF